eukprot:g21396.t1
MSDLHRVGIVSGSLSHHKRLVISSALKLLDHVLKQTRYYSHIAFLSTCLRNRIIPNGLQSTFRPSQFGPNCDDRYIQNIEILQKCFSLRLLKHVLDLSVLPGQTYPLPNSPPTLT